MKKHLHKQVYLDNAATTCLDPVVLQDMLPYLQECYANPSAPHGFGSVAKTAVERARRRVNGILQASGGHLFFVSGGTEANNLALQGVLAAYKIKHVVTSCIEHVSVLQPLQVLAKAGYIELSYVGLDARGQVQYDSLATLLQKHPQTLVSLMHGNNEIGNLSDLHEIGRICKQYKAIFHTDMVQTLGYYGVNLQELPVDLCTGSAHKFHGPKGIGLLYVRDDIAIRPIMQGGMQERGLRGGTENVAGIVGLARALEVAHKDNVQWRTHLQSLKTHMIAKLLASIPGIVFYGQSSHPTKSLCNLLSVGLPLGTDPETLLFNLSIQGVAASTGSACMSGAGTQSHVLRALGVAQEQAVVRFAFSKYNVLADIDYAVACLQNQIK